MLINSAEFKGASMIRAILGVIIGYLVMVVIVFCTFTASYFLLGADRTFQPGNYEVTGLWLAVSLTLSFIAALAAGKVCRAIGGGWMAVLGLVALVVVLGGVSAVYAMLAAAGSAPVSRTGNTSNLQAMMNSKQPISVALALPAIGAVGVLLGARKKKR
jgi:hypothetical protein